MAKQLSIVYRTTGTGTFTVVKKLRPGICFKYGSVGNFFPLNWRGGANFLKKRLGGAVAQ